MLNNFLISDAFAQAVETTNPAASPDFSVSSFVPLVLIFLIFYFLIVRPQSKKMKDHQNMINNLKIGNKVVTSGGIVGVVKDVLTKENQIEVEIADGVSVKILRNYVAEMVVKDEVIKNKK
jgi:preprotein translocase subunit YajC